MALIRQAGISPNGRNPRLMTSTRKEIVMKNQTKSRQQVAVQWTNVWSLVLLTSLLTAGCQPQLRPVPESSQRPAPTELEAGEEPTTSPDNI